MPLKGRRIDDLRKLQHLASMKAHKTPNSVQPYGKVLGLANYMNVADCGFL